MAKKKVHKEVGKHIDPHKHTAAFSNVTFTFSDGLAATIALH